jgi:hypothetical protein
MKIENEGKRGREEDIEDWTKEIIYLIIQKGNDK